MLVTDGVHIVSTESLDELHELCAKMGISKAYYEGWQRGHPHYDVPKTMTKTIGQRITTVPSRMILEYSKELYQKEAARRQFQRQEEV